VICGQVVITFECGPKVPVCNPADASQV